MKVFTPRSPEEIDTREIKINPQIVKNMFENFKLPVSSKEENGEFTKFQILDTLKALAHNKHNDHTTTYSLLHKKWINSQAMATGDPNSKLREVSEKRINDQLVVLNPNNYE